MNWRPTIVALTLLAICLSAQPARAVLLFLKGKDQPIRGYFLRENEHVIVIRELLANGQTQERVVSRSEIEDVIKTVSPERLEALTPDSPNDYRDYAEELAEKRKDPDARVTSIRLFQIAAYLAPDRLGRSSLLGMVPLARDESEQRRFQAMAYLLDPTHNADLLRLPPRKTERLSEIDPKQAEQMLTAFRLLRRGEKRDAKDFARRSHMEERLPLLTDSITYSEFVEACRATCPQCTKGRERCPACQGRKVVLRGGLNRVTCTRCGGQGEVVCRACGGDNKSHPLSPSLLKRIVRLELDWLPELEAGEIDTKLTRPNWSRTVQQEQLAPILPLRLLTLTEFDPRKNVYREGKWRE
jgi:hypothetical protein